jgi:hypothetical protein
MQWALSLAKKATWSAHLGARLGAELDNGACHFGLLIFCAILQDARLSASLKWTISRLGLSGMIPRALGQGNCVPLRLPLAFRFELHARPCRSLRSFAAFDSAAASRRF